MPSAASLSQIKSSMQQTWIVVRCRAEGLDRARLGRQHRQGGPTFRCQRAKPASTAWTHASRLATTPLLIVDMQNGRTLEFTVQPMENGGMVVLVEDVTERKIAEARINQLARFDALTGLPNRTVLRDRMERALGAMAARQHVRHSLHRFRPIQTGQRHAWAYTRRHAVGSSRRAVAHQYPRCRRHFAVWR